MLRAFLVLRVFRDIRVRDVETNKNLDGEGTFPILTEKRRENTWLVTTVSDTSEIGQV